MTTSLSEHVADYFLPIDPSWGFLSITERIVETASHDSEAREAIKSLHKQIGNPLDEKTVDLYRRIHGDRPEVLDDAPGLTTAVSLVYMRAKAVLRATLSALSQEQIKKGAQKAAALLASNPTLLGELLIEAELRASRDETFARGLSEATEELQKRESLFADLATRLMTLLDEKQSTVDRKIVQCHMFCHDVKPIVCAIIITSLVLGGLALILF